MPNYLVAKSYKSLPPNQPKSVMSHKGYFDASKLELEDLGSTKWLNDRRLKPEEMLYQNDDFADFTIKVEDKEYRAHRLILAIHSDYFHGLFLCGPSSVLSEMICGHNVGMEIFDPYELILCECSSGHSELPGVYNGGMETFYLHVLNLCAFEDSLSL